MIGRRRQPIPVNPQKRQRGVLIGGAGVLLFFIPSILMVFLPSDLLVYLLVVMVIGIVLVVLGYITLRKAEAEALEHVVRTRPKQ